MGKVIAANRFSIRKDGFVKCFSLNDILSFLAEQFYSLKGVE